MSIPVQKQFIYSRFSDEVGFPYSLQNTRSNGYGEMDAKVKNETLAKLENEV
jgi:hypothetical protein